MLSDLNKRIIKSFEYGWCPKESFQYWKNESKREVVQLFEADDDDRNNINDITNKETKKVIPSSGQGITVNKRIVKLGELTPSKNSYRKWENWYWHRTGTGNNKIPWRQDRDAVIIPVVYLFSMVIWHSLERFALVVGYIQYYLMSYLLNYQ